MRSLSCYSGVVGCLLLAGSVMGQVAAFGPRANQFPDIIVSSVGGSYDGTGSGALANYGSINGISAYAIGSDSCNIGSSPAIWFDSGTYANQHPVIGGQMYRLFNGRFEQLGSSWLKHGFCAADNCSSGNSSGGLTGCANIRAAPSGMTGNCQTDFGAPGGGCDWLGYGRATDTYSSGLNGGQTYLGPRSEVNPWTGYYPYPYVRQGTNTQACLNKRLLVRRSDLDPALYPSFDAATNPTGAIYFAEVVYVMTDEWPLERYNNYSYRRMTRGTPGAATGSGNTCGGNEQAYGLSFTAQNLTVALRPAIEAWRAQDPSVVLSIADAPNDGRFYVGAKVTNRGDGTWQYEYAVLNMNSDRGAGSFIVPKPAANGLAISKMETRHPEAHSGEPYSLIPWTPLVTTDAIRFDTDGYMQNANSNAIRWSQLHNFRFIANRPPKTGSLQLGLFKPAMQSGDADSISIPNLPIPGDSICPADFDRNNVVEPADIFAFLGAWFQTSLAADMDNNSQVEVPDIFLFLEAWFDGCP